ncbi:MAG: hypothetical protein JST75_01705 [Bacteroidetes bacterium]|nr:hypothetical protein [Bacteroidota bacterium]
MKKKLLLIGLVAIVAIFVIVFFVKKNSSTDDATSKTFTKSLSLTVYKDYSYTSTIYNNSLAQVRLILRKINPLGENTIVWNKTLDSKSLSQYPSAEDAVKQNFEISNISAKNEYHLEYDIIYNSKGSELQMQYDVLLSSASSKNIAISI